MKKRWFVIFAVAFAPGVASPARAQEAPVDSLALARQYTGWLYEGKVDSLLAHTSDRFREGEVLEPSFARLSRTIAERAGTKFPPPEETWKLRNGRCQYWRIAWFTEMDEKLLVRWVLDPAGRIDGLGIGPLSQAPPVEAETCGAG